MLFFTALALAVGVAACGGDDITDPDPEDAFDFSGPLVAFVSNRHGHSELYLTPPDGPADINLPHHHPHDHPAAWAPARGPIPVATVATSKGSARAPPARTDATCSPKAIALASFSTSTGTSNSPRSAAACPARE